MKKIIRITEADIVNIVKKLITENTEDHVLEVNFSSTFPSGQFDDQYINAIEFRTKMKAIVEFVNTFKNSKIEITVIGGESQVSNPRGFEEKGSLAKKRSQVVSAKIRESLEINHVDMENIKFTLAQPVIGDTEYRRGVDNPQDDRFRNEQFIKAVIKVVAEDAAPSWCSASDSGKGAVGKPETGFVSDYKRYELKGDVGSIILKFDPIEVPDMFIVRYDNQTYNTGFIGNGDITYRVKIATVLATYYQGKDMPEHFKGITLSNITSSAYSEFEKSMMADYNTFANFLDDIAPIMPIDASKYKNWKQFRKSNEFKKLKWSDMTPAINHGNNEVQMVSGYRQLSIPKKRGVSLLELWVIGTMGTTRWNLKFSCESNPNKK